MFWSKYQRLTRTSEELESMEALLSEESKTLSVNKRKNWLLITSCFTNLLFFIGIITLYFQQPQDLSLLSYSPANSVVEYLIMNITTGFMTPTTYMGYPTDKTDEMWENLFQFGNSYITEEEASQLLYPTIKETGTENYLVQLDVFHQLHCLNDLRKILYPERFPTHAFEMTDYGHINRKTMMFRHWDHCIDVLRQSLMCHADVSPISWRLNVPVATVLAPHLETTHTCRNFTKVVEWAKEHHADNLRVELTQDEIDAILKDPPFDQGPWEDLSRFWRDFPGNKFFREWRDNSSDMEA